MGILDHVRGRVLARIGAGFQAGLDDGCSPPCCARRRCRSSASGRRRAPGPRAIQSLLGSAGTGAVFDLPWAPLYIAVMFLFHHGSAGSRWRAR